MTFSIEVISEPEIWEGEKICYGQIIMDGDKETFHIPLSYWQVKDYKRQWAEGLKRIINQKEHTLLIQSMRDPKATTFILWWVLYYETDEDIYVQQELIRLSELKAPLDLNNPYIHIDTRITVTDEGHPVSEWKTNLNELKEFLEKLKRS